MMSEMYRRRIRVEGGMKDINGCLLNVSDADTGENIRGVGDIVMHLSATGLNTATITYVEFDEQGHAVLKDDKLVEHTGEAANPEVAVTAMETMSLIEQLQAEVQMYRDASIAEIRRRRASAERQGDMRILLLNALSELSVEYWREGSEGKDTLTSGRVHRVVQRLMRDINEYAGVVPLEPIEISQQSKEAQ